MTHGLTATAVLMFLAVTALGGCDGGSGRPRAAKPPTTLAEGRRHAQDMVDVTLAQVAAGRTATDAPGVAPAPCDTPTGPSPTLFTDDYSKRLELHGDPDADELLRRTEDYWRSQGYSVHTRDLSTRIPVVFAEVDGFNLSLQVVRDKALAQIGASTPCLPRG